MGQSLDCSTRGAITTDNESSMGSASALNLCSIGIVDFERRVKRFAHPMNKGRVTVEQLCKAFEDTGLFEDLRNPFSLCYKILLGPFFREIPLEHYKQMDAQITRDVYVLSEAGVPSHSRHKKKPSMELKRRFSTVMKRSSKL